MDFYVIPPNAHLELMHEGDRYFCLAQVYLKNENYRKFFKERVSEGKWVTLDNGIGDGDQVTEDVLFDVMKELMPSEVIPPDVLFDAEQTISNLNSFVQRMDRESLLGEIEVFGCPQGETRGEWLSCYMVMLTNPNVKTIGLSKIAVPYAFNGVVGDKLIMESRQECYDYLIEKDMLKKPIHCLGAGHPLEFEYYNHPLMRSTDSCFSVWAGMNCLSWNSGQFERVPTPKDYFERGINEDDMIYVHSNINYLKEKV